jgi:hypothetical protein
MEHPTTEHSRYIAHVRHSSSSIELESISAKWDTCHPPLMWNLAMYHARAKLASLRHSAIIVDSSMVNLPCLLIIKHIVRFVVVFIIFSALVFSKWSENLSQCHFRACALFAFFISTPEYPFLAPRTS